MHKKKRYLIVAVALIVCTLIGARIWWVNVTRIEIPAHNFSMNEEVKLNGAFIDDIHENTKDYSLTVKSAQVMSANEYLKRYSRDGVTRVEGGDVPNTRIVLEVEFKNSGSDGGQFNLVSSYVIGKPNKNTFYRTDTDLWLHREVKLADANLIGVGVRGGTSYTTYLPFYMYRDEAQEFFDVVDEADSEFATVKEKEFDYLVATKPQHMTIDLHV